jgi:hypothetical protein
MGIGLGMFFLSCVINKGAIDNYSKAGELT